MCIGGTALARGYLNQPSLTAQRFPDHPRLGRIYRTGDLVHRDPCGDFFFHGRRDAQVKVRGYRIELEAIEACLSGCDGVRAAVCAVQGEGAQQIVAFVVPANGTAPDFDHLRSSLHRQLPEYMVPAHFGVLAALPVSISGKLDRRALPSLLVPGTPPAHSPVLPRNPLEARLAAALAATLTQSEPVSIDADFFNDLGGNSLLAAQAISRLRDDPTTAALTVRDLYEARTVAALAHRVPSSAATPSLAAAAPRRTGRPILATVVQTLWLVLGLLVGAPIAYVGAFDVLPLLAESLGVVPLLLLAPLLYISGIAAYTLASTALTVLVKKALIGRYRPVREPIWGSFYVRNWIVQHTARLMPWRMLEGTPLQALILRALGARIGRRVHIHRGVNLLQGGWDLLDIGDEVTLSQDAAVQLVDLADGHIVVGPVTLESGSTLEVRAGVGGNTRIGAGGYLTALSYLPPGQRIGRGERLGRRAGAARRQGSGSPLVVGRASRAVPRDVRRRAVAGAVCAGGAVDAANRGARAALRAGLRRRCRQRRRLDCPAIVRSDRPAA